MISSPFIDTKSFWASLGQDQNILAMIQKAKFSSEKSQVVIRVGFYKQSHPIVQAHQACQAKVVPLIAAHQL